MAYKCTVFEAVNLILQEHYYILHSYVCRISKVIGINKEEVMCLANKEYINGHRCERSSMAAKYKILIGVKTL